MATSPIERIDDAVRRILTVKFELGLFERPLTDDSRLDLIGSDAHRELARQAVRESLVLLHHDGATLPVSPATPVIFVAGEAANDIGIQSGGWSIQWQGRAGSITPGTTILDAINNSVAAGAQVNFNRFGNFERINAADGSPLMADVGIVVVGERPYAEGVGDRADLYLSDADIAALERTRERSEKLIVIRHFGTAAYHQRNPAPGRRGNRRLAARHGRARRGRRAVRRLRVQRQAALYLAAPHGSTALRL
jgi:beta-glucosidase